MNLWSINYQQRFLQQFSLAPRQDSLLQWWKEKLRLVLNNEFNVEKNIFAKRSYLKLLPATSAVTTASTTEGAAKIGSKDWIDLIQMQPNFFAKRFKNQLPGTSAASSTASMTGGRAGTGSLADFVASPTGVVTRNGKKKKKSKSLLYSDPSCFFITSFLLYRFDCFHDGRSS